MTDIPLRWLEHAAEPIPGTTWGVPWVAGRLRSPEQVIMTDPDGAPVPLDSWVTARWPDGSIKWTGHSVGALSEPAESYRLTVAAQPGEHTAADVPVTAEGPMLRVSERSEAITVDTGVASVVINTSGPVLISELRRDGVRVARGGRLISLLQTSPGEPDEYEVSRIPFTGHVTSARVERDGDRCVVIKVEGRHRSDRNDHADWLPFQVR
ncbi:MAG TPA: hypothetical protein VK020_16800, partial [Microlunatus sp.]|nr:hypothetical protein [Microlunatus sp.]